MPRPLLIFSQSDYLIRIVAINSHTKWQIVQIQISWLLQKPTDLDLHCLHRQGISWFSRTRVKLWVLIRSASVSTTMYVFCGEIKKKKCYVDIQPFYLKWWTTHYIFSSGVTKDFFFCLEKGKHIYYLEPLTLKAPITTIVVCFVFCRLL